MDYQLEHADLFTEKSQPSAKFASINHPEQPKKDKRRAKKSDISAYLKIYQQSQKLAGNLNQFMRDKDAASKLKIKKQQKVIKRLRREQAFEAYMTMAGLPSGYYTPQFAKKARP